MPSGKEARRLLLFGGLLIFGLFILGLVIGAIGSSFVDKEGYVPKPEVHLPPQAIFPASTRNESLGVSRFTVELFEAQSGDEELVRSALAEVAPIEGFQVKFENEVPHTIEVTLGGGTSFHDVEEEVGQALAQFQQSKTEAGHFEPLGYFDFAVTNTMLSSWVTTIVLVLLLAWGARRARLVPGRLQNLVEIIVEALLRFVESVVGRDMGRRVFPVIATIFLFVLFNAWLSLLPIYPSLGFQDAAGDLRAHLLRSAGTDLNMPLALALISFVFVEYWGVRSNGLKYFSKFFSLSNLIKLRFMNLFVGFLEFISELVRIVSFTFRLFGNMTAGEILVVMVAFLVPFVASDFVYGLELLVGLVQALIFAGLTLVFVSVAMGHNSHSAE